MYIYINRMHCKRHDNEREASKKMANYPNLDALVFNPSTPYSGQLPYQCKCGLLIIIKGVIPCNAESFYIHLLGDDYVNNKSNCDVIFEFSPKFDEHTVIRNTRINGKWGKEEKSSQLKFPFDLGSAFKLFILVQDDCFKVAVDENHFIDYEHREDISKIKWIEINDDVQIDYIEYRIDPRFIRVKQSPNISNCLYKPRVPLSLSLKEKKAHNLMIFLSGRPDLRSNRFTIDLCQAQSIALHFSVRFDEQCIVINSFDEKWHEEERFNYYFPFESGLNFDLIFFIKSDKIVISINGHHCIDFNRLLPVESIDEIKIKGDLILNSIGFS